jgi:hypothetical protein
MSELFSYDFMQRALLAAVLVGMVAPLVGVFLVQRRLSLVGDGMGHVALAGVAVGLLTNLSPVWAALVAAVLAAVAIELIRASGRTQGDVALAVIFYGGIAAGVVILSKSAQGTPANLTAYLFGAITTVKGSDLWVFAVLAVLVLLTTWLLRPRLFAVASDEEYARAMGMPVLGLNLALAVLTAGDRRRVHADRRAAAHQRADDRPERCGAAPGLVVSRDDALGRRHRPVLRCRRRGPVVRGGHALRRHHRRSRHRGVPRRVRSAGPW